jgi:hypothetical protein
VSAPESGAPRSAADRPAFDGIAIADASGHGLRVQVEHQVTPNLALAVSGIGVVRRVVVHNERLTPLAGLSVAGRLEFGPRDGVDFSVRVAGPLAPGSATLLDVADAARAATIRAFDDAIESSAGTIELIVRIDDEPDAEVALQIPVRATAGNEFTNHPQLHAAIAAFVRPNARAVTPILRAASDLLLKRTGSGALEGYQAGPERATRIAGAVYEAVRATGVTYTMPPASFEFTGQKVRTTDQVLADRFGTCIDLAVLYAACLEASGLSPVIFLTRNHAFAGFTIADAAEVLDGPSVIADPNLIANLVESRLIVPVELTGISPGSKVDFKAAVEHGRRYLRTDFDLVRTLVDISKARLEGVLPMPVLAFERPPSVAAEAMVALPEDRPFVARSSLANLSDAVQSENVRGRLEHADPSPARFHSWKRDLLDLSLRNPLLNLPRSGRVVDLIVPGGMLGSVEDTVQQGSKIKLSPADGVDGLAQARGVRTASELDPSFVRTVFTSARSLFTMVDGRQFARRLLTLKRDAESLEQETGSNYLYLAIGSLVHLKPSGEEARAPLFLLPVTVSGGTFVQFGFQAQEGESAVPNLCLVQWLQSTKGVRLAALENPPTDDNGLAIDTAFTELRRQLAEEKLPFRIDETASLALLKFSTFQIWHDLDENWQSLMRSPIVEHLVERPGETFADPRGDAPVQVDEASARLPVPADGSQLRAIAMARAGRSFVLEGPPGTGKSQTITNLIADLLRAGRTVLFVAEKQAALEVVHERLHKAGLGGFTLQLHGDKQSIGSIRSQLKTAIETRRSVPDPARQRDRARFAGVLAELGVHPSRVHAENGARLSLWAAYDQLLALDEGPSAAIPPSFLASADAEAASDSVERWSLAAATTLLRRGEPWLLAGPGFASGEQTLEERTAALSAALPALDAALSRLDADAVTAGLLAALPPSGALQDAQLVVDRARADLAAPVIASQERTAWLARIGDVRVEVVGYRTRHAQVLTDLAPAAFTATDLGSLRARSVALDDAWFFPGLRRRRLRRRLAELAARTGFVEQLPGEQLTPVFDAAISATAEASVLHRSVAAVPGMRLPDGWAVWAADALDRFDEAVAGAEAASRVDALLGEGGVSRLTTSSDPAALQELVRAWSAWCTVLDADDLTIDAWVGEERDWLAAWRASAETWRADLERGDALRPQRLGSLAAYAAELDRVGLGAFARRIQGGAIAAEEVVAAFLRGVAAASVSERLRSQQLADFDRERADALAREYVTLGARVRGEVVDELRDELIERRPFDPDRVIGEVAELKRQAERKRGGLTFRALAEKYQRPLQSLAPCFLMSPGSVAHYLPADFHFDVVVFDEASQIRVSQSVGALGRGDSAIIVGDSRQMPPTRIMEVSAPSSADSGAEITETVTVEDLESILDEAVESGLPREWLSWHYRSHDERLIAFSNSRYYENRLVTLPSPRVAGAARQAGDVYGLEWRRVDGTFDRGGTRTNQVEAEAIVAAIRERLADPVTRAQSIGVVTFNIQQRELVRDLLEVSPDLQVQAALGRTDGEELFVKNLENVQGDERDVILFSLAFSKDPSTGRLPLQFGPLILEGGERRLNVAITRARMRVVVFSSFDPGDIDLSRSNSRGLRDLRGWLEYAAGTGSIDRVADEAGRDRGRFIDELAVALAERGLVVERAVGLSKFKLDLAVRRPEDERGWRLGVIADGPSWAALDTVSDRDGAPALLESIMRWPRIERVWLPAWIRDRDDALEAILSAVDEVAAFDAEASAAPPPVALEVPVAPAVPAAAEAAPAVPTPAVLTPEAAPESAGVFAPFEPAPRSVVAEARVLDDVRTATPAVMRYAREALAAEGPIELERLCRTIAARFGLTRVVQRRRDDILAALGDVFPRSEGGRFVWPEGSDPAAWTKLARTADASVRPIAEISLQELGNGLVILLRGAFSLTEDEAVTELARAFGTARAAGATRDRLHAAIEEALRSGRILRADGRITLP